MPRPDSFDRPPGWSHLEGAHAENAVRPGAEQASQDNSRAPFGRFRSRRGPSRRLKGLGDRAAGPDFHWPFAPATPEATGSARSSGVAEPSREPRPEQSGRKAESRGKKARKEKRRNARASNPPPPTTAPVDRAQLLRRTAGLLALYVGIFVLVVAVLGLLPDTDRRTPNPPRTPAPTLPQLAATWSVQSSELRPDLGAGAELLTPLDGSFDPNRVVAIGNTWAVLSGDTEDRRVAVHGLDAATGHALWRTDLPNGVCAATPLKSRLVCAASTATDPATGLGTRWRISLLDPTTGRETKGVDFAGWLTLMHADGDRVLLVEQRQPAPHAVLTGLDADLRRRWQLDLRDQPQHAGLFSDNRIYYRKLPIPDGPALDRPRIRKVADGLTALWSGQTTAFVDLRAGKLVGMPRCSRLVDDGKRLWCNDGPLAASYSYTLRKLHQTALNTRLAFPYRDPRGGDVTDPVFLETDGRAVRVDPATGGTLGPLAQTRNGSSFGVTVSPQAWFVAGRTLLSDSSTLFAVDARTGKLHWQRPKPKPLGDAWLWQERLLFTDSVVRVVDPADGREQTAYRQRHGLYTVLVGDTLVGIGPDEIARLADP